MPSVRHTVTEVCSKCQGLGYVERPLNWEEAARSPETALAWLVEAGICQGDGQLMPQYRSQEEQ